MTMDITPRIILIILVNGCCFVQFSVGQSSSSCNNTEVVNCVLKFIEAVYSADIDTFCRAGDEIFECLTPLRTTCADNELLTYTYGFENSWTSTKSAYCSAGGSNPDISSPCNVTAVLDCMSPWKSFSFDNAPCSTVKQVYDCLTPLKESCADTLLKLSILRVESTWKAKSPCLGESTSSSTPSDKCGSTVVYNCFSSLPVPADENNVDTDALCRARKKVDDCLSALKAICTYSADMEFITEFENKWKSIKSTYCRMESSSASSMGPLQLFAILVNALSGMLPYIILI